jgi:hypothetical protein
MTIYNRSSCVWFRGKDLQNWNFLTKDWVEDVERIYQIFVHNYKIEF